ncbi:type II secretion system F family protein [Citricoccus sp. GCM10030269]|uniref:type II secretion system F family protein n=1 Tax=Citricoccus sp. GCM10030269 TaxID=3273388 RepID=UPI00361A1409
MPPIVIIAALAVAVTVPLLGWALFRGTTPLEKAVRANLRRGLRTAEREARPRRDVQAIAKRFTPAAVTARLDRSLSLAGRPPGWPLGRVVTAKFVLAGVGLVLGVLLAPSLSGILMLLVPVGLVALGYLAPDLVLRSRGKDRQQRITQDLPDILDQMTIAVEAGLGFDAAMSRTAHSSTGPLAEEFVRTLQDVQVGRSRREAYMATAERTTSADLRQFIRAVVQADAFGVSIAGVLKSQAAEMRVRRRQRAEEKAQQIPVKILMPLMLFILPVLFIVLLGPAAINALETLG